MLAAALAAMAALAAVQREPGAVRTLDKGTSSNVDTPRQAVARTEAEFARLWKQHSFDRPMPPVDFSRDMVVAVFLGSRPTAGFGVEITGTAAKDAALVVTYRETAPPAGAVTAQILTSPYHIAAVPKREGTVTFEKAGK